MATASVVGFSATFLELLELLWRDVAGVCAIAQFGVLCLVFCNCFDIFKLLCEEMQFLL